MMVRSRIRGNRKQEIIVDGVTAKIKNRILMSGEKILENSSLTETLDKAVDRKPIIYALYDKDDLYYVGQSDTGSLGRVWDHIRDKHKGKWNRFAIYRIKHKRYLDDIESILIRTSNPKGNTSKGGFADCEDLTRNLKEQFIENFETRRDDLEREFKKLEDRLSNEKEDFEKREQKILGHYDKKIRVLEGKDAPKIVERRRRLKRERKDELEAFEKKKRKVLGPLQKEIGEKSENIKRLQKLVSNTRSIG